VHKKTIHAITAVVLSHARLIRENIMLHNAIIIARLQ
jgi:hypothetical protein